MFYPSFNANLYGRTLGKAEWIDNRPRDGFAVKQNWICQRQSKLRNLPKNPVWADLCQPVTCEYMCVCLAQDTRTSYLMQAPHTSTADYVVLSSHRFICLHLWCGIPWSRRNTVLGKETEWIRTLRSSGRSLPLIPPRASWSLLSLCLLRSITRSITSPAPPTSICTPTAIHYSRIFSSVQTKVIIPGAVHIVLSAHSRPTPQLKQLEVIWALQSSQLISLRNH